MRNNPQQNRDFTSSFQRLLFTVLIFVLIMEGFRNAFLEKAKYNENPESNFLNLQRCIAFLLTAMLSLVSISYTAAHSLFPDRPSNNGYSPLPQNEEAGDHTSITVPKS